ncbi:MAG: hypothetical protein ABJG68_13960 [Crocinitomicaceae bacterium]
MKNNKLLKAIVVTSVVLIVLGSIMHVMHWPGAKSLLVAGYALLSIGYPQFVLNKENRTRRDLLKGGLIVLFAIGHISYWLLLPDKHFLIKGLANLCLLIFAALYIFDGFYYKKDTNFTLLKVLFVIGAFITITGLFLKMMHWPFARIGIYGGFALIGFWMILELFRGEEETED